VSDEVVFESLQRDDTESIYLMETFDFVNIDTHFRAKANRSLP
jgi:hypothetical protein